MWLGGGGDRIVQSLTAHHFKNQSFVKYELNGTSIKGPSPFVGILFQTNDVHLGGGGKELVRLKKKSAFSILDGARGRASSRSMAIELRDRRNFVVTPSRSRGWL